jgi:nucleotide-binding universal stress UspA family protein
MYRDILVPLDGSPVAESALPLAALLAESAHARLHLTLIHEPAPALVGMGGLPLPSPDLEEASRGRETAYLAGIAARWHKAAGSQVEFRLVQGRAGPDLCEEAAKLGADLVVMTTHGRGALQRLWLGSVADYLVRHLTIPVLLLPRRAGSASTNPPTIRHISWRSTCPRPRRRSWARSRCWRG